jgi:hypothetical protein
MYPYHNFHGTPASVAHYIKGQDFYGNRGQWDHGDLMIHWPGTILDHRINLAKMYNQYVIK